MTSEELIDLLEGSGITVKRSLSNENELNICCPFCVDRNETQDERYRLGFNIETGHAHCFNCSWATRDRDYLFAALSKKLELGEIYVDASSNGKKKYKKVYLPDDFELLGPVSSKEDYWGHIAYRYVRHRGITYGQIKQNRIGYSMVGDYAYRIVFPVYYNGKLKGIVSRDFTDKSELKYKNSEGIKVLYHVHNSKENQSAVLSEGVFDAFSIARAVRYLGYASFAVLGHSLTDKQIKMLVRFRTIYIWLDPDKAGMEGIIKTGRQLLNEGKTVYVIMPEEDDDCDPSDLSRVVIRERIKNARLYTDSLESKLKARMAFQE